MDDRAEPQSPQVPKNSAQGTDDPAHVFISHASQDSAVALALVETLEGRGIACWMAPRDVDAGSLYAEAIIRGINDAKAVVVVLSVNAIASANVGKEIERAAAKKRPIYALRMDGAPLTLALEYFLSESQWVDAQSGNLPSAFAKLTSAILKSAPSASVTPLRILPSSAAAAAANPRRRRSRSLLVAGIAVIAVTAGVSLTSMIRDAARSSSVVIHPIDIAPNMSAPVPSGKMVAQAILDALTKIQAATRTNREHRSLRSSWASDRENGPLENILKRRFGHDQQINGDLVQTDKGGLALTVRGTGILPKTFTDEGRNLDHLLTQASEYVFGQGEPLLLMRYLIYGGRYDDAIKFAEGAYGSVAATDRPAFLTAWAYAISGKGGPRAMQKALPLWRESVRLKPDLWSGYGNIMTGLIATGREEEAIGVAKQMMKIAGGRPGKAPEVYYLNYDLLVWDLPAMHASQIADLESHGGIGANTPGSGAESLGIAQLEVQMHDLETAVLRLETTPVNKRNPADVAAAAMTRAMLAEERDDLSTAAKEWDEFSAAATDPTFFAQNAQAFCYSAVTYQMTGQIQKADAALDKVGSLKFVDCYRFRGDVLDLRGDWAGAQEWYAKAVKLVPSSPAGYYSWGIALMKHGDLAGAATKLQLANEKGPHWADPLKAWGDVLVKQGHAKEALAKYDEALKYAPNWKQLKEAREAVAKQKT